MNWMGCELVERVPGKVSGQPVVVGTRVMPDAIVADYADGSPMEEIQENYPALTIETIRGLLAFAEEQRQTPSA